MILLFYNYKYKYFYEKYVSLKKENLNLYNLYKLRLILGVRDAFAYVGKFVQSVKHGSFLDTHS